MTRGVSWFLVAPLVLLGLSGCKFGLEQRERWRTDAEERCVAGGLVKPSAYTIPIKEIDGAGTCGMDRPFRVLAFNEGAVEVSPKATLACPITASVDRWLRDDIQPAAMAWFGQPVAKVKQMSAYSCRNMNGGPRGKISEHAFGNAFDIGGFVLADGREVTVKKGWKGRPDEQGFLRTVQATGCQRFSTVLGPGSNIYHYDHIHVDLMRRASGRSACNPRVTPPPPPNLPVYKAPAYKAPLFGAPWGESSAAPAEEPVGVPAGEEGLAPEDGYGSAPPPSAPQPAARPAPAHMPAAGEPMVLSPPPSAPYASSYPAADPYPAQATPAAPSQNYPGQTYPAQGYPAQAYPAPSAYPSPAPYPAASDYPSAYPAAPAAAPPAAAPSRRAPPGVPLPPASIPLAKWLGLDPTPTGSTGKARSYTDGR